MADRFTPRLRNLGAGLRDRVIARPEPPPTPAPPPGAPPPAHAHATGIERALHNPGASHRSAQATSTLEHLLGGGVHIDPASHQQVVERHSAHTGRDHRVIAHPNPEHFERPATPPNSPAWWMGAPKHWPGWVAEVNMIARGVRR